MFAIIGFGVWELVIVAGIILLLFGNRLPGVMRSMGRGITEFKRGVQEGEEELSHAPQSKVEHDPGKPADASKT